MIIYQDLTDDHLESFTKLFYSVFRPTETPNVKDLTKDFYTTHSMSFVALEEGKVISLVIITVDKPFFSKAAHGHISWVCTEPSYRGKGIAKVLLQMAESWAKTQGASFVDLSSNNKPDRAAAHKLYSSMGYNSDSQKYFIKHLK